MNRRAVAAVVWAAAVACGPAVPFRLVVTRDAGVGRFRLVGAPGARINARLAPALELENGTVLRFASSHRTADSAYFADAPSVAAPLPPDVHRGTVRASVCPTGERICRIFVVAVRF